MTFYILTLGCKVNQYESEYIASLLKSKGYVYSKNEDASVIIINSCTVTSSGDNKALKYLRHFRRKYPFSVIVLTGCLPQAFPDIYNKAIDADIIIGNSSRKVIPELVEEFLKTGEKIVKVSPHLKENKFEEMLVTDYMEKTRAFVKIQDGCNRFCSYCIIPYARGRVRSKPLEDLKRELAAIANNGYKEVVLVGINLSTYGEEFGLDLSDAILLADSIDGIERIRLGSLEPERMDKSFIEKISSSKKLCPQFHLSLQSGCTSTLKRMNRHYTADEYAEIVENIRNNFKNSSITTDVMVGFPGETEEEFNQSLNFVKDIKIAKTHVFSYSRRKGTVADKMENQIPNEIKAERSKKMIAETDKLHNEFLNSQVGLTEEILLEQYNDGYCDGYTKNYCYTKVKGNESLCGKIYKVKITEVKDNCCFGVIEDEL